MNVLFIPSYFPTSREPFRATYVYEYARSLALRHDVKVVYPQQLGAAGVGDRHFFTEEWLAPRLRFVNYTYSHLPKSWILSYLMAYRRILRRVRREWKPDIIFAHIVMPAGPAALLLRRALRVPVILTEHWGPARDWLEWSPYPRKLQYRTLAYTYRHVDYLTAVSDSLAGEIGAVFGGNVHGKLDYPIDCELFKPQPSGPAEAGARVLCVTRGGVDPRKGVANLLAAWEIVQARSQGSIHLDLIGEKVEELGPQINQRGISPSCHVHPWVPATDLAVMMRGSTLVVIPSSYETFGRSGAEALACGVPVVATRCGGPQEYVEEGTGLLVPTEDPTALAEAVLAGVRPGSFLPPEELSRRVRERFSYEAICNRFTEVAAHLTNGNNHH